MKDWKKRTGTKREENEQEKRKKEEDEGKREERREEKRSFFISFLIFICRKFNRNDLFFSFKK